MVARHNLVESRLRESKRDAAAGAGLLVIFQTCARCKSLCFAAAHKATAILHRST